MPGGAWRLLRSGPMERPDWIRREHFAAGAIYGTVVYVSILVLLEEDGTDPANAAAILAGTAVVFWLAHIYAHLVPRIASKGRLRTGRFLETAQDQAGILVAAAIPMVPLALAMLGLLDDRTGLWLATAAGLAALAGFSVLEARVAGAGWWRSFWIAAVLLAGGLVLLRLEVALH